MLACHAETCPDGYEYNSCGSPCTLTCENHEDPPVCLAVCGSGCFCPTGTVQHNGNCIAIADCPGKLMTKHTHYLK